MAIFLNIILGIMAVLFFLLVVLVHEFGHFFTAKKFGVKVNEFAIGMGPKLWKKQKGETLYSLRMIPIGGFCEMEGEDKESSSERSFSAKPAWQRMIIIVAGALMNVILAFVLMSVILAQQENFSSTTVKKFSDNAVTNKYGLQVGDEIVSIDGYRTITYRDLNFAIATEKDLQADIVVKRNNEITTLPSIKFATIKDENGNERIAKDFYVEPIEKNFGTFFTELFNEIVSVVRVTYTGLIGLITGKFSFNDISGPVGIVSAIGTAAAAGLEIDFLHAVNNIVSVMVILTVGIGLTNLLPLPALDGGRFVILLFEAITKKKINPELESKIHTVGFILLLLLMVVVAFNDVLKFFR